MGALLVFLFGQVCVLGGMLGSQIPGESSLWPQSLCHGAPMREDSQAIALDCRSVGASWGRGQQQHPEGFQVEVAWRQGQGLQTHNRI